MPYYTAELHYIGPMIAFVVDDVDNHDDDQVIVNDVNDDDNHDDKHGENAIGQVCYNDIDNHADDDHDVGPMIAFVVDDVDNHGDDNHGENAENV